MPVPKSLTRIAASQTVLHQVSQVDLPVFPLLSRIKPLSRPFRRAGSVLLFGIVLASLAGFPARAPVCRAGTPAAPAPGESTAGFELEPEGAFSAIGKAESDSAGPAAELDELRGKIALLQKQIEQKQDIPDTTRKFSAKAGGMLEIETVTVDQSQTSQAVYGDIDNDYSFRDVRLWVKGEGYENLSYNVTLGFTGRLSFKNVMLTADELPILGKTSVGHFDVEMGMNYLQSTYNYSLVEQDSVNGTFSFGRRLGIGSVHYSPGQSVRLFTGVYTGKPLAFGDKRYANENCDNVGILLNTRLTAVPLYRETADGRLLEAFHLGGSFCWVNPGKDSKTGTYRPVTLQASPTCWLSDMCPLLEGELNTNSYSITGIETAWQRGRLGLTGEGFIGNYHGYDNAYGVAATGRFLLTPGAYQAYDKSGGYFGEVVVPENMRFVDNESHIALSGWGAWEILGQWSWTDLDNLADAAAKGAVCGRMSQYTAALNWYWNPQVRWGINWIYAKPVSGSGGAPETSSSVSAIACQARFTF